MAKIFLVRHGETQWNEEKRYQGHFDIPLNHRGRQQAERVAAELANIGASAGFLVSSDLARARDTAAVVGKQLQLPVICCSLWRERCHGRWEGLTREEIQELYPEEWRKNRANPHLTPPGGGETLAELKARAIEAMGWVLTEYAGQTGIIVSHGGVLRTLLAWIAHQDTPRFVLNNGGISVIKGETIDELAVVTINETAHLADL
ncbi:MAG: histidine phosphatase family protein [Firmicutes bacterium]|nr:histidine phosphatase family protein [Bacillota bacterium]